MNRREAREQAFFLIFEKTFKDEPLEEILEEADFCLTSVAIRISDTACFEITGTDHELAPRSLEYGYRFQTEKIPSGYRFLLSQEGEVMQS